MTPCLAWKQGRQAGPVQTVAKEKPPGVAEGPRAPGDYKYQAVIRKKAEREALVGYDCPDCKRFYEAIESWGLPPAATGATIVVDAL